LLLNNEIHSDTYLYGFEFFAVKNGSIGIKVCFQKYKIIILKIYNVNTFKIVSGNYCGEEVPCAVYYTMYPFNKTLNIIYEWDFDINYGFNKLILDQPLPVYRGYFILLEQKSALIAIDVLNNATYSDLVWNSTTRWTKLAEYLNWRFYLNAMTNFTIYETKLNIVHSYNKIGVYRLSLYFPSSNKTFEQMINVTDCNFIFF
jgi:hypothetical protein